jgi:hypothetical protein
MRSHRAGRRVLPCAALLTAIAGHEVAAQAPPMLPSTRIVQAGPASLYPAISLRNVGTDSNVYNDGVSPKEDFTYTLTPRLYAVVPIGGTRFVGAGSGDFVYYRTYTDQQSVNGLFNGRYEVVDAAIRPFASASLATHRERQNLEIDVRARQTQTMVMLGGDVEVTPLTSLTAWVQRENTTWDRNQQYMGVSLAEQLNSTVDIAAAGARFRLTPFTSLTTAVEIQRDRFERSPERDADSLRIAPTVEFDSGAAITGRARVGYRSFRPLSAEVDDYRGLVASAGLRYAFDDITRLYFDGGHEVKYSFDPFQPYYIESGLRVRLIQRISGPFEAVAIAERWKLRYQRVGGQSFDGRQEDTTTLGGGVGLRLSREMELTFTIDRTRRASSDPVGRDFERRRVLASISYGL